VVTLLRDELIDLRDAGCDFVQFDEPVLTEIVMSEDCDRRTFM
jgi:5-methyltetrahydropteroyltriglutamate--homocysteine methyltransferase